jgi:hypothetical protein
MFKYGLGYKEEMGEMLKNKRTPNENLSNPEKTSHIADFQSLEEAS